MFSRRLSLAHSPLPSLSSPSSSSFPPVPATAFPLFHYRPLFLPLLHFLSPPSTQYFSSYTSALNTIPPSRLAASEIIPLDKIEISLISPSTYIDPDYLRGQHARLARCSFRRSSDQPHRASDIATSVPGTSCFRLWPPSWLICQVG